MSKRFRWSLAIIAGNLVPIVGIWLLEWDVAQVLAYLVADMLVIGAVACLQSGLRGEWTCGPLIMPFLFSFLIIQLFASGLPIIESEDNAAQARAWIVFIGRTMPWPLLALALNRSAYWLAGSMPGSKRNADRQRPVDGIESGARSMVMFFAMFFTLFFYQGQDTFNPIIFVNGLLIGKILFEVGVEYFREESTSSRPPTDAK